MHRFFRDNVFLCSILPLVFVMFSCVFSKVHLDVTLVSAWLGFFLSSGICCDNLSRCILISEAALLFILRLKIRKITLYTFFFT